MVGMITSVFIWQQLTLCYKPISIHANFYFTCLILVFETYYLVEYFTFTSKLFFENSELIVDYMLCNVVI